MPRAYKLRAMYSGATRSNSSVAAYIRTDADEHRSLTAAASAPRAQEYIRRLSSAAAAAARACARAAVLRHRQTKAVSGLIYVA